MLSILRPDQGVFFMRRGLTMSEKKQWYTNKDLFELITDLQKDMQETRAMIRKYNGLYDKVADVKKEVDTIQSERKGRQSVGEAIRNWGGWIFGLASFLVLLSKILGG